MTITNLLTNMVALALHFPAVSLDIPTNTPAFKDYAFQVMLTNAETLAAKFNLDTNLVVSNKVTEFYAVPTVFGIRGGITFAGRYGFGYKFGRWTSFSDNIDDKLMDAAAIGT